MKRTILSLAVSLAVAVPSLAWACDEDHPQNASVKKVSIPEVAKLTADKKAKVFDANNAETRAKYGVIPGAALLTSFNKFDAAKELPAQKDAKLVFYCANEMCKASEQAAQRALEAGYVDVNVLPEGIMGWKSSGQKTAATPRS
jgi:rhodanese-related sulfurtransferase